MTRMTGENRDLLRRQRIMPQVLELWLRREISTTAIAEEVGASEAEICAILEEAEGREPKFDAFNHAGATP